MEFLTEAAGKNLHLEHLEDEILNFGIAGGRSAIEFLQSLRDMFAGGGKSKLNVTVKWDGAPAVFAGPHPETGKFFVAKKALFRKTQDPQPYYHTYEDIDADTEGELNKKMKVCLDEFSKLGMKEILQGDLMFTDDLSTMTIDGVKHITFQPNTILYAVPSDSEIGRQIKKAKVGIVWHTTYKGNTIQDLKASFGAKLPGSSSTVWQDDATYRDVTGAATFTAKDTVKVTKLLSGAGKQFHRINSGKFNKKFSILEALLSGFPAGTVSGAPKIRAMEIIDELEPVKRGVYSGAVGYISWNGNMDTAIAIRTAVIKDKTLHIQAGAGIVADSVPKNEWDETMNKGRAIFKAVSLAEKGLT